MKLAYLQIFCDENLKRCRPPFSASWPETLCSTVQSEVYGDAIEEECKLFTESRSLMTKGWTESFDKLESYLK